MFNKNNIIKYLILFSVVSLSTFMIFTPSFSEVSVRQYFHKFYVRQYFQKLSGDPNTPAWGPRHPGKRAHKNSAAQE